MRDLSWLIVTKERLIIVGSDQERFILVGTDQEYTYFSW
jgi:hypothetical protein